MIVGASSRHGVPVAGDGPRAGQVERHHSRAAVGRDWGATLLYELREVEGRRNSGYRPGRGVEDSGTATRDRSDPDAPIHAPGPRSPCRRWCRVPGRRSCRVRVRPARCGGGAVRGSGAIGARGGDRRERRHDHVARRFHRRHRRVPAPRRADVGPATDNCRFTQYRASGGTSWRARRVQLAIARSRRPLVMHVCPGPHAWPSAVKNSNPPGLSSGCTTSGVSSCCGPDTAGSLTLGQDCC